MRSRKSELGLDKRCVECGQSHSRAGSRCRYCERLFQATRNAKPERQAYRDPLYLAIPLVGTCRDCGTPLDLTRHHELAVRRGGTVSDGIVILCRSCNSKRG